MASSLGLEYDVPEGDGKDLTFLAALAERLVQPRFWLRARTIGMPAFRSLYPTERGSAEMTHPSYPGQPSRPRTHRALVSRVLRLLLFAILLASGFWAQHQMARAAPSRHASSAPATAFAMGSHTDALPSLLPRWDRPTA